MKDKAQDSWIFSMLLIIIICMALMTAYCRAETPQAYINRVLAFDGYTAEHCLAEAFLGSTFSQVRPGKV